MFERLPLASNPVPVGFVVLAALSLDFRREVAIELTDPSAIDDIRSLFHSIGVTVVPASVSPAAATGGASC